VVPHGVAYEEFKQATENEPPVMRISEGAIAVMFESSRAFTIKDYAWNSDKLDAHDPKMWDNLTGKEEYFGVGSGNCRMGRSRSVPLC
jgi:homogentisate 1,2-dioxygenase